MSTLRSRCVKPVFVMETRLAETASQACHRRRLGTLGLMVRMHPHQQASRYHFLSCYRSRLTAERQCWSE